MKSIKRVIALCLCFFMLITGPIYPMVQVSATNDNAAVCSECGLQDGHSETCSLNTSLAEMLVETDEPKVGDQIWIKSGSTVYKNHNDVNKNFYTLKGNYLVEVKKILTNDEGDVEWYEFRFTNLGIGEIALSIGGYKYVHIDNTSVEEPEVTDPVDNNACNCGENAPENIANHADSCPRKQYIKTLFDGKTAEEIYAQWGYYDGATQTDVINMLQKWDVAKYEVLINLINGTDDFDGFDTVYIKYAGTTTDGISANIIAPEGAFPEGTSVSVTDDDVSESEVESVIEDDILGILSVDISFNGMEPIYYVNVSMNIPANKVPVGANKVIIVHMSSNGPEVVGSKFINSNDTGESVAFITDSFSSYAAVFVNGKYDAKKMDSILENNDRYQIAAFNVDLFDYDPVKINNALNSVTSDGNGFHFTGYGISGMGSNNGINNTASTHAKQGILQNNLIDGLPVFNYLNGTDAGKKTGEVLFGDSQEIDGKTVYNDIPFEFIYDAQTGYYEYKSSVNHAQLNETKNRIELYADTLSTENSYVATIDLSTANGSSDFESIKASSSFSATVKDTNNNNRLDPYVIFSVDNINATDVGQIYVKAKVPSSVGENAFQLFFTTNISTGWEEAKSFGNATYSKAIPYTANGDWIEFVIDTSENSAYWKDTITAIRVDLFDSNKGSSLNVAESYNVEIAEIRLIKKDYDAYATRGGFYPFSEIQDSYPGNNTAFSIEAWESVFLDDSLSMARASRSIFNPTPSSETLRYDELAFGVVFEYDFYLPVERIGLDGKDLTYYFNGDDDLWVFVDDQLVLDIGGGHGAITGSVNFTKGIWSVDNANTVTGYNSGADSTYGKKSGNIAEQLFSPGKHTIKIFYLERGGSVSNCFMKFNLPRTPQGSVVVSKEAVEKNNANNDELIAFDFEFQISIQNNGTGDYQEVTPWANADYYVVDSDGISAPGKTDASGKFLLKSSQKAIFDIDENYNVTITETKEEISDHEWVSTTVNGEAGFTKTQLTVDGQEKKYDFVNTYERLYGDLKISKTGISSLDQNAEESQSTIYAISGTSKKGEVVYLEVDIVGNSEVIIKHVPIGTYTVTEITDWSWRYEPKTNDHSVSVIGGNTAETIFENVRTEDHWLSGDSVCENWWGGSDGSVVRKGKKE